MLWLHLDYKEEQAQQWFTKGSGFDPIIVEALRAEDTRPRCTPYSRGQLIILRSVNLNPGADPEDMISVRLWLEESRIISFRHRKVMAIDNTRQAIEVGDGPVATSDFLAHLTKGLSYRIGDVMTQVDDAVDALEDEVIVQGAYEHRSKLSALRRKIIRLRRYLSPQREIMTRLLTEKKFFSFR